MFLFRFSAVVTWMNVINFLASNEKLKKIVKKERKEN